MTTYNSINKLCNKNIGRFEDLKIKLLEESIVNMSAKIVLDIKCRNTIGFTDFEYLHQRTYGDMDGLLIHLIEKRDKYLKIRHKGIKIIKPIKKYKAKLRLYKKYNQNIKY